MSERLSPIERLARRICWLEFSRRPEGKTEAAYWRGVHPDKKREYIEDARWLVWMSHRLEMDRRPGHRRQGAVAGLLKMGAAEVTARDDAARLRAFAKTLAGPWDRMEDGRELIVMAFPAGEADAASKLLRQAAREIETGQRILSL